MELKEPRKSTASLWLDPQVATDASGNASVASTPVKIRIYDIQLNKKYSLFCNEANSPAVRVTYVATSFVEGDHTILVNELTDG